MQNFVLTDLVDAGLLQEIQEAFAFKSNITSGITDANGVAVTEFTQETDFCEKWTKGTSVGLEACENCAKRGAHMAMEMGRTCVYQCHAGLFDFAAPIVVDGVLYGIIVGGQVMPHGPSKNHIYRIADKLGIDREQYWEAAREVPVVGSAELKEVVERVYSLAMLLSDIASNKYRVLLANEEVGVASKMKSDFLANMSHEIRTPMNAVIGMADMALREELPAAAREYILQIKRSGKTLLAIINDILDFSKIESGKMDISLGEYTPMNMLHDVANIIATRIADKDVELTIDVPPDIPGELMGDAVRIKQVIINLANNAVKFTNHGQVAFKLTCTESGEREQELTIQVKDTGIGIKETDLVRIFDSFQQVDSKRNRNIEGTGLGLAISKRLVELMGGYMEVKSVYEMGSRFSFCIPQLKLHEVEAKSVSNVGEIKTAGLIENHYVREQLELDITRLGGTYRHLEKADELSSLRKFDIRYLFVDMPVYCEAVRAFAESEPAITVVLMERFHEDFKPDLDNLIVYKKPVYTFPLIGLFNHEDAHALQNDDEKVLIDFEAPDAKVLIVDDNEVNLTVAAGLMAPLHMQTEKALSGKTAIEMITDKHYDLVFMDHMMPEMDGVETTRIIRRMYPDYDNVPIIALTANVMEETKAMFLVEGMNDFLAKPIEVRALLNMVRQWLPPEKIREVAAVSVEEEGTSISIPGLDLDAAFRMVGSEAVLLDLLNNYYRVIPKKIDKIKTLFNNQEWRLYTVEVHALKSASRQIGANELADFAMSLEKAGNDGDIEKITRETDALLAMYADVRSLLAPVCETGEEEVLGDKELTGGVLSGFLDDMMMAMDDLDMDAMNAVIEQMKEYRYGDAQRELFDQLREAVEDLDIDQCEDIILAWRKQQET